MTLVKVWHEARGEGKKTVARLARRVLPRRHVCLKHVEPGLRLTVSLRRHVMFWSGGLARYEPLTVGVLRAAVETGDWVLDIGSNIGFFTTLFSRWVGPEGRVLAVEPEPENLALLRQNIENNACDNVIVSPFAVGAAPGVARFSLDDATGATGCLGEAVTAGERAVGTGRVRLMETHVETIDRLAARHKAVPRVVKMDIEGGELEALRGAPSLLAEDRPIIVSELTGGPEAAALLRSHGYRMWDVESGRPVEDGHLPFLVVAIAGEALEDERSLKIRRALRRET
jgi:FkbM family methyltransferase